MRFVLTRKCTQILQTNRIHIIKFYSAVFSLCLDENVTDYVSLLLVLRSCTANDTQRSLDAEYTHLQHVLRFFACAEGRKSKTNYEVLTHPPLIIPNTAARPGNKR